MLVSNALMQRNDQKIEVEHHWNGIRERQWVDALCSLHHLRASDKVIIDRMQCGNGMNGASTVRREELERGSARTLCSELLHVKTTWNEFQVWSMSSGQEPQSGLFRNEFICR